MSSNMTLTSSVTIPKHSDQYRVVPTSAIQCALFRVGGNGKRAQFNRELLHAGGGRSIYFTGTELRSDDLDVLMAIFNFASGTLQPGPSNGPIKFAGLAMLNKLNWPGTGYYYRKLAEALDRLQRASIRIEFDSVGENEPRFLQGNLIRKFAGSSDYKNQLVVHLEHEICYWLAIDPHLISWEERVRIARPLGKWLHAFISALGPKMGPVFSAPEAVLMAQCGSSAANLRGFRASLRDALEQMKDENVIHAYSISDGVVFIAREPGLALERCARAATQQFELAFAEAPQLQFD